MERKLYNFTNHDGVYHIGYGYYIDGKATSTVEKAELTDDELYRLLKPALVKTEHPRTYRNILSF